MKSRILRLLLFVVVTVVLGILFGISEREGFFKVTEITVVYDFPEKISDLNSEQNVFINTERGPLKRDKIYYSKMKDRLKPFFEPEKGINIWRVDVGRLTQRIRSEAWVEEVNVSRRIPNQIIVRIVPKKLLAGMISSKGVVIPIGSDSSLLPEVDVAYAPDMPILRDSRFTSETNFRQQAIGLLEDLPNEGPLSWTTVSEVSSDRDKTLWLSLVSNGIKIRLGSESVPLKIARVSKVLEYMDLNEIKGRVIDADFSKKVVVRLRNHRQP